MQLREEWSQSELALQVLGSQERCPQVPALAVQQEQGQERRDPRERQLRVLQVRVWMQEWQVPRLSQVQREPVRESSALESSVQELRAQGWLERPPRGLGALPASEASKGPS